jgi:hypothetical protein
LRERQSLRGREKERKREREGERGREREREIFERALLPLHALFSLYSAATIHGHVAAMDWLANSDFRWVPLFTTDLGPTTTTTSASDDDTTSAGEQARG